MTCLTLHSGRFFWSSVGCAAASLLAVFRAPAKPLWYLAIVVTEWGYWFGLGILCFLIVMSWKASLSRGTTALFLFSAGLCFSPLVRAQSVIAHLPTELENAFGSTLPRQTDLAPARAAPLVWKELWTGIKSPGVQKTTYAYAHPDGQMLSLDLYRPLHPRHLLPGVLIVHGGSWQSGGRTEFEELNRYLAARGYAVAVIDYRLSPRWIFPAARNDVYAALDWLHAHATVLGLDKEQWVILGRSAGGQIALCAAYEKKDPSIRGVIALYAPNDLKFAYAIPANPFIMNSQKVIATYIGGTPEEKPALYAEASPLNDVNALTPPTLMIHGLRDELVWAVHDQRLSTLLAQTGRPSYFLRLPWATHAFDAHFCGPASQLSLFAIERFLSVVMPIHPQEVASHV